MTTFSWIVEDDTTAKGMAILAMPPIADGSAETSAQATRDGIAAVEAAAEAAGTTIKDLILDRADSGQVVYVLSDGTHLLLGVAPDES